MLPPQTSPETRKLGDELLNVSLMQEDGDNIPTLNFQAMNSYRARINAANSAQSQATSEARFYGGSFFRLRVRPAQAQQQKNHFQKFIDSILAKSAKMRALVADLKRNYSDEMATK